MLNVTNAMLNQNGALHAVRWLLLSLVDTTWAIGTSVAAGALST